MKRSPISRRQLSSILLNDAPILHRAPRPFKGRCPPLRSYSTQSPPTLPTSRRWRKAFGGLTGLSLAVGLLAAIPVVYADESKVVSSSNSTISTTPTSSLLKTYLVYTITSIPVIVDYSPKILSVLTSSPIPGVKSLTEWGVRHTFFSQFVGGETVEDCEPVMEDLRRRGIGTLLAYSVEVDEDHVDTKADKGLTDELKWEQTAELKETLRGIEEAGRFEKKMSETIGGEGSTWLAVKITGLIKDPSVLHRASNTLLRLRAAQNQSPLPYPGTSTSLDTQIMNRPECYQPGAFAAFSQISSAVGEGGVLQGEEGVRVGDEEVLRRLWGELKVIGQKAKEVGVKIVIDAEHTWYQPALDAYTMMLSEEFNKPSKVHSQPTPLVYGTYQAYLRRTPLHLEASIKHAKDNGYCLGVKLVRGAYHEQERKRWIIENRTAGGADPIWENKPATDVSYNNALKVIVDQIARDVKTDKQTIGVLFGTHNHESCRLVVDQLGEKGLLTRVGEKLKPHPRIQGRVCIGQLYGMSDELTDGLAERMETGGMPLVLKYLPYGRLSEVLPYLGRRAVENKALLSGEGGATAERRRVWKELKRRYWDPSS